MKPILVFVLGAIASAGVVYVVMNKQPAAAPVATASVPAVNSTPPPEVAPRQLPMQLLPPLHQQPLQWTLRPSLNPSRFRETTGLRQ